MKWINFADSEATPLHVLPCSVKYDGPIDGKKFTHSESDGVLRSKFRGRILHGRKVDLHAYEFTGYGLDLEAADEDDRVKEKTKFDSIMVWEHGKDVDRQNTWVKVEELLKLARALN